MRNGLIAILLFSAAVSAQSQQPPRQQGQTQTRVPPQDPQVPAPPVSLNISGSPTVIAGGPDTGERENNSGSDADWAIVRWTQGATVIAFALAVIAWIQFRKQTTQTMTALGYAKEGVDETRAANTHAQVEAAKVEQRSRTEMILAHPPRLAIRNVSIPLIGPLAKGGRTKMRDLSDELTGEFLVANIGRNDASIEAVYSQWIVGELPMTNPCQGATGDWMNLTLKAGMSIKVPARPGKINWGAPSEDGSIDLELEDDLTAILDRRLPVYLIGFVAYRDTLSGFRQTFFCRMFNYKAGRFKPVSDPDYNYKD